MFATQSAVSQLKNKTIIQNQITNTNFNNISLLIRRISTSRGDEERNKYKKTTQFGWKEKIKGLVVESCQK